MQRQPVQPVAVSDDVLIPPSAKGFPAEAVGMTVDEVVGRRWTVHERFNTPVAVLDRDALDHNVGRMATWCQDRDVELWPHGKTTMAPEIFTRQLAAGATGITAATMTQVRAMWALGVSRVLLANEVVQPAEAVWAARELAANPDFELLCLVDSPDGVRVLEAAGAAAGVTFRALLEIGVSGGRTGSRTRDQRERVISEVAVSPHVSLVGIEGYEGPVAGDRIPESLIRVREYLAGLRSVAEELAGRGVLAEPVMLSAGGSVHFDLVAEELAAGWQAGQARIFVRSGCYVSHDSGVYEARSPLAAGVADPLRAALTVWTSVLSRPEPGRVLLDAGRRDVSFDNGLPTALRRRSQAARMKEPPSGLNIIRLSDQHSWADVDPDAALDPGDRLELGISHPCTTFDKWRFIPIVDADGTVVEVATTWF